MEWRGRKPNWLEGIIELEKRWSNRMPAMCFSSNFETIGKVKQDGSYTG